MARTFKERKAKDTVAIGTYGYAPPEQYGKGQTDARSDVYTLGATLYHLLTNLRPDPAPNPDAGAIQQVNPSVRPQTEQVIIKAMQQDRELRWRSAGEMEQALAACLQQPVPVATPAPDATQRTVAPVVPPRAQRQLQVPYSRTRVPAVGPTKQMADPRALPARRAHLLSGLWSRQPLHGALLCHLWCGTTAARAGPQAGAPAALAHPDTELTASRAFSHYHQPWQLGFSAPDRPMPYRPA